MVGMRTPSGSGLVHFASCRCAGLQYHRKPKLKQKIRSRILIILWKDLLHFSWSALCMTSHRYVTDKNDGVARAQSHAQVRRLPLVTLSPNARPIPLPTPSLTIYFELTRRFCTPSRTAFRQPCDRLRLSCESSRR